MLPAPHRVTSGQPHAAIRIHPLWRAALGAGRGREDTLSGPFCRWENPLGLIPEACFRRQREGQRQASDRIPRGCLLPSPSGSAPFTTSPRCPRPHTDSCSCLHSISRIPLCTALPECVSLKLHSVLVALPFLAPFEVSETARLPSSRLLRSSGAGGLLVVPCRPAVARPSCSLRTPASRRRLASSRRRDYLPCLFVQKHS